MTNKEMLDRNAEKDQLQYIPTGTPEEKLQEMAYDYMAAFRMVKQNNHLHPWVAAREGFLVGYCKARDKHKVDSK